MENEVFNSIRHPEIFIEELNHKINELDVRIARLRLVDQISSYKGVARYEPDVLYLMSNYLKTVRKEFKMFDNLRNIGL